MPTCPTHKVIHVLVNDGMLLCRMAGVEDRDLHVNHSSEAISMNINLHDMILHF